MEKVPSQYEIIAADLRLFWIRNDWTILLLNNLSIESVSHPDIVVVAVSERVRMMATYMGMQDFCFELLPELHPQFTILIRYDPEPIRSNQISFRPQFH